MMKKLSQPMIDMLIDARSNGNQLRGKTNTTVALMDRSLAYLWVNTDGGPNQVRLTADGVGIADTFVDTSLSATINDDDTPEVKRERAEVARLNHYAVATNDDRAVSFYLSPDFLRTKSDLMIAIRGAYPDVDATEVYRLWADNNESIAYNVAYYRERIAEQATDLTDNEAEIMDEVGTDTVPIPTRSVTDTQRQVDIDHARGRQERGRRRKATRRAVRAHAKARRRRTR